MQVSKRLSLSYQSISYKLVRWTYDLASNTGSIDGNISEIREHLLSTVKLLDKVEQARSIVDKGSPALALNKGLMCDQALHKRNVGFDAANAELDQGSYDLASSQFVSCS